MLVLSGGTGTPKLLLGLKELLLPEELSVVVNTAEDLWVSGNYISPDLDSVIYTLADMIDEKRWWGIKGDRTWTHDFLIALGCQERLQIGDKDRAVHIFRSELLRRGATLSQATQALAKSLGVEQKVVPMSDDAVSTMISTPAGQMHFQDFWVDLKGKPEVRGITFTGMEKAVPSPAFLELLDREDTVLIGPSNPVTSIGPILALPGVRERLAEKRVIAMSPLLGDKPASGPAAKFMSALGAPAGDEGVRALLGKVDLFVVDKKSSYRGECRRMSTRMKTRAESRKVAEELLAMMEEIFHQDRTHC
ncbi:MAG: LPPG:FO 2-phospho-L-lactate transferase [Methanosaeta sp. NSM2]|nr:2-phospho-L-lactate transferase [Methanothrix sp.]OYV12224.1 MAG: LPPG:FO 2-phospho-L-lactate transferase [Methanosaeta sp. NSM2]